jgi:flavin reductase (DIM6/NTAB) family NADH-FMN oxidoreductase RutF
MAKAVRKGSRLNVNFLYATQRTLSDIWADKTKADMQFSRNEWLFDSSGTPYIDQCEMVAFCEVDNIVIQSTHTVAFLTVTKAICPRHHNQPILFITTAGM